MTKHSLICSHGLQQMKRQKEKDANLSTRQISTQLFSSTQKKRPINVSILKGDQSELTLLSCRTFIDLGRYREPIRFPSTDELENTTDIIWVFNRDQGQLYNIEVNKEVTDAIGLLRRN